MLTLPEEIKAGGQTFGLHPERAVNPSDDGFRKWGAQSIESPFGHWTHVPSFSVTESVSSLSQ